VERWDGGGKEEERRRRGRAGGKKSRYNNTNKTKTMSRWHGRSPNHQTWGQLVSGFVSNSPSSTARMVSPRSSQETCCGKVSSWGSVMGAMGTRDGGVQLQVRACFERVGNDGKQKHPVPDFHSRLTWAQLLDWIWLLGLHGLPACNAGSIRRVCSAPTCMDAKKSGKDGTRSDRTGRRCLGSGACQTGKADGTGSLSDKGAAVRDLFCDSAGWVNLEPVVEYFGRVPFGPLPLADFATERETGEFHGGRVRSSSGERQKDPERPESGDSVELWIPGSIVWLTSLDRPRECRE
jgi:hypothetical protein